MNEVPIAKVRANQIGIVITIAIAVIIKMPWLIAIVWLVQVMTRLLGSGANTFVILLEPIARMIYGTKKTEADELQKFNLSLGITFLTLSLVAFSLNWLTVAYIIAGAMALAALAALFGYCIGCTFYYQYKKYKSLRNSTKSQ